MNDISESRFTYSRVFAQDTAQSVVFHECVGDILNGFLEGGNGLIFSYGATNSGKTYTMQGTFITFIFVFIMSASCKILV
jgi:kinesin family protein 20